MLNVLKIPKLASNVMTLIMVAQKSFLYPQKPQSIVVQNNFMVKVRFTLFSPQFWS